MMIVFKKMRWQLPLLLLSLSLSSLATASIPKLSEVLLTSQKVHPIIPIDPNDTLQAQQSFHANRIVWVYLHPTSVDENFVSTLATLGIPVQGALNTEYYFSYIHPTTNPNKLGIKLDVYQQPSTYISEYRYVGCPASPIFQKDFFNRVNQTLSLTQDSIQLDHWTFDHFANPTSEPYNDLPNSYNCYCDYCLASFRKFLATQSPAELASVGITDVSTFDYRKYLLNNNLDINAVPLTLQQWWNSSALLTLTNFWNTNYEYIQTTAGTKVDVSTNGLSDALAGPFDYFMSELLDDSANPQGIYDTIQSNLSLLNRRTVFIHDNTSLAANAALNRQLLGWVVGSGGNLIVPWNIWIKDSPYYYANPQDIADLYGMIRAVPQYIDGYAAFKVAGANLVDQDAEVWLTVANATPGQANTVSAFVRTNTVASSQPWVIHLVDSATTPQSTILTLAPGQLTSDSQTSFTLTLPLPYCPNVHSLAESTGNYKILVRTVQLPFVKNGDGSYTIQVPPVSPWGIIVVNGTPTG